MTLPPMAIQGRLDLDARRRQPVAAAAVRLLARMILAPSDAANCRIKTIDTVSDLLLALLVVIADTNTCEL